MKKTGRLITNIQKYSLHDGEGIRTTVFFKGCPLSCKWCHNPETQQFEKQLMTNQEKCTGCGACVMSCSKAAIYMENNKALTEYDKCDSCGECTTYCLENLREMAGREYTLPELIKELKKDEMFYEESGGGVTLSGGEVMCMDMEYIEQLVKQLHRQGISVTIDTCGFAPYDHFERILPYIDTFLYDVKMIDSTRHKQYTGVENDLILENLKKLSANGAKIYIRIPVIKGVNAEEKHIKETIKWLLEEHIQMKQVNLLPYHNTGSGKYARLEKAYEGENFEVPTNEEMARFAELFKEAGISNIKIGG